MTSVFTEGVVLQDSDQQPLAGVSDIELIENADGSQVMIVASESKSALTSYTISPTGEVLFADSVAYSAQSGTQVVSDVIEIPTDGDPLLLVLGRYDDNYAFYTVGPAGELSLHAVLEDASGEFSQGLVGDSYQIGSDTYFVTANYGTPGVVVYKIDSAGNVTLHQERNDTDWRRMGDVTVIHHAELQGRQMMFIGSEQDPGLNLFSIRPGGRLKDQDRMIPVDYEGFYGVSAMVSVQFGDRAVIVVA